MIVYTIISVMVGYWRLDIARLSYQVNYKIFFSAYHLKCTLRVQKHLMSSSKNKNKNVSGSHTACNMPLSCHFFSLFLKSTNTISYLVDCFWYENLSKYDFKDSFKNIVVQISIRITLCAKVLMKTAGRLKLFLDNPWFHFLLKNSPTSMVVAM